MEGIGVSGLRDGRYDTLMRKFRSVTGVGFAAQGQGEAQGEEQGEAQGEEQGEEKAQGEADAKKWVGQTTERLGAQGDRTVDMELEGLVGRYESEHGGIELREYDWQVPLGAEYCMDSVHRGMEGREDMLLEYRDEYLTNQITSDSVRRIVVVWGWAHMNGVGDGLVEEGFRRNFWYTGGIRWWLYGDKLYKKQKNDDK